MRALLVCGLVAALLVPGVVWWVGHQATVEASASTGVPHCEGTEPRTVTDSLTEFERAAIPLRAGFSCTVAIRVVNHSDRVVTLGDVTVPVSGPQGGGSFQVTHLGGVVVPTDDAVDAAVELDWSLDPGAEELVEVRVVFRGGGCTSPDTSIDVDPDIEVRSLLASHDLTVADLPLFVGTADSSCDV